MIVTSDRVEGTVSGGFVEPYGYKSTSGTPIVSVWAATANGENVFIRFTPSEARELAMRLIEKASEAEAE